MIRFSKNRGHIFWATCWISSQKYIKLLKIYLETRWGIPKTQEPREDPITEKPKEGPKSDPSSWRPRGRPWKGLVELKADFAKQYPKKKYWRSYWESMKVWYWHNLFFFQMMMPLLAYLANFSEHLHFPKIDFFTVRTSSEQLDFKSNYFDSMVTFFK